MTNAGAEPAAPTNAATATKPSLAPRPRFECIDGLRAVAALLVFLHHVGFLSGATYNTRVGRLLGRFDVGVPIFFAISGFLLFYPHARALFDDTDLGAIRRFYVRRFFRIYPAYWAILGLVFLLVRFEARGGEYLLHVLLLQIYKGEAFLEGMSQSWSLAVEVSFYLSLPLLVRGLHRLVVGQSVGVRAVRLLGAMAALVALSTLWRAFVYASDMHDRSVLWLPGTIDYFAIGMALATISVWAQRSEVGAELAAMLGRHDLRWWLAATSVLIFVAYQLDLALGLDRASWHQELFRQLGYDVVALAVLVPVVFGDSERGLIRRILRWRPLAAMGTISYSFYLWHLAIIETWIDRRDLATSFGFLDWTKESLVGWTMFEITVGSLLVTTALATVTYYIVERPLLAWSRSIAP
ncbi:MAG: acyltransferase [Acidimicrobiales bacterium]